MEHFVFFFVRHCFATCDCLLLLAFSWPKKERTKKYYKIGFTAILIYNTLILEEQSSHQVPCFDGCFHTEQHRRPTVSHRMPPGTIKCRWETCTWSFAIALLLTSLALNVFFKHKHPPKAFSSIHIFPLLPIMKTRTVNIRHKSLTSIVIPKVPLNTISFVTQDLTQAYLEAMHRLVPFY